MHPFLATHRSGHMRGPLVRSERRQRQSKRGPRRVIDAVALSNSSPGRRRAVSGLLVSVGQTLAFFLSPFPPR